MPLSTIKIKKDIFLLFQEEEDDLGGGGVGGGGGGDWQSLDRLSLQSQEEEESQQGAVCGRVAAWQRGFDNLLSDTYGLFKFTEFLKQEFSHENIYFWCACERYRLLADGAERLEAARSILERHLEAGAPEPVNVDWTVRADSGCKLAASTPECPPPPELFLAAQRQIYNLMKFDSYPRFLKSGVYATCLKQEMRHGAGLFAASYSQSDHDASTAERSRPARAGGTVTNLWSSLGRRGGGVPAPAGGGGSAALSDQDRCDLTRVILPDGSTSVVSTTTGESIRALVARLLDKRGLRLPSFDVFATR
jgi:regulator of G-protein signaling